MTMIPPVPHSNSDLKMKTLIYGNPGTGKTTFAGTARGLGRMIFIDVEGGMLSVPSDDQIWKFHVRNLGILPDCITQFENILCTISANNIVENPWLDGLQTVVLDSGSEFLNLALEAIVDNAIKTTKRNDPSEVWLQDYGKMTSRLTRIFRHLRDLPYNIIVTALSKSIYPPNADNASMSVEPIEIRPAFTQKLGESVMGFFDNVWYAYTTDDTENDNQIFSLLTQPKKTYRAKTRGHNFSAQIGSKITDPDFTNLYQILIDVEGKG